MPPPTDKRAALLQAALELFAENGFTGSPTALIAKRAGVASGTLFLYFKCKEDLIRELFREVRGRVAAIAFENLATELPLRERFLQVFARILQFALENPQEFKFMEQYHFSPFCDPDCGAATENEAVRDLLLEARKAGSIKDLPLPVLKVIAFGPLSAAAKEHATHGLPVDGAMAGQIVQACWDALKR